jgi:hypothetical protein
MTRLNISALLERIWWRRFATKSSARPEVRAKY